MCRCNILAHIITADTARATGSVTRNSLALKRVSIWKEIIFLEGLVKLREMRNIEDLVKF